MSPCMHTKKADILPDIRHVKCFCLHGLFRVFENDATVEFRLAFDECGFRAHGLDNQTVL